MLLSKKHLLSFFISCRGRQKPQLRANTREEPKKEAFPSLNEAHPEYVSTRSKLASTTHIGEKGKAIRGQRRKSIPAGILPALVWIATGFALPGSSREPQTLNLIKDGQDW